MWKLKNILFFCLVGIFLHCSYAVDVQMTNSDENDQNIIDEIVATHAPPKLAKTILEVFPQEIMDQFLKSQDIDTLSKTMRAHPAMSNLKLFRKKFVDAINKFRDDVRNEIPFSSLAQSFEVVLDACECDVDAVSYDAINLVRFIFLCKFTASLKPSSDEQWQLEVNIHIGEKMSPYIDRLLQNKDEQTTENLKHYIKALSMYDYSAFSRFAIAVEPNSSTIRIHKCFLILIKYSEDHMRHRFERRMMASYLHVRNIVNAYDFALQSQDAIKENNQITKLQYKPDYTFNMIFSKTPTDPTKCHLSCIRWLKHFVDKWIRSETLIKNPIHFKRIFVEIYVAVHDLCSYKQQKNELLEKANVNLALFELVGKHDKYLELLANELKKLYAGTPAAKTELAQQLKQLDEVVSSMPNPPVNLKADDECYIECLHQHQFYEPGHLPANATKVQIYYGYVRDFLLICAQQLAQPNGFRNYKLALKTFRSFGSNANVDFSLILYYGLFALIEDKHLLDQHDKLLELIEIEKLHEEAFFEDPIYLKVISAGNIFPFGDILDKLFANYGQFLRVSSEAPKRITRSSTEQRIKQRFVLKAALCLSNEVFGIDFVEFARNNRIIAKYNFYIDAEKAQRQVFEILKFFYASATYLSDELIKDRFLLDEFCYFAQALSGEMRTMYIESEEEEAFEWMHKPIDAKSPAFNSIFYLAQVFVPHSIHSQLLFGDQNAGANKPQLPKCFFENLLFLYINVGPHAMETILEGRHGSCVNMYIHYSQPLIKLALRKSVLKQFVDIALDWIMIDWYYATINHDVASVCVLRQIFIAILEMKTAKEAEKMLTKALLIRIDQVTFGYICENPRIFSDEITPIIANTQEHEPKTQELYREFKVKLRLEITPPKIRD